MTGRHRIPEPVRPPIDWRFWAAYAQAVLWTVALVAAVWLIYFAAPNGL